MPSRRRPSLPTLAAALAGALLLAGAPLAAQQSAAAAPAARAADARGSTTVIVVRHAERAGQMEQDPTLSEAGRVRAEALAAALAGAQVEAIYSTQFRRTRETVEPLARATGVPVTLRPIDGATAAGYAPELARHIRAAHAGGTVVVVGHSNTVPAIVGALTGAAVAPIPESQYGDLYVITLPPEGAARLIHARVGS